MSSKLYKKYLSLKKEDPDTYYLFKNGIFYIFISDDAKKFAPILDLKLSNLNTDIVKCGFPITNADKYFKKIEKLKLNVQVVTITQASHTSSLDKHLNDKKVFEIICEFSKVDIDSLSISQAFTWLSDLQEQFKKIT